MAKASKPADLRLKSEDELQTQLLDLKREQFNLRFQRATGQNEGAGRVREVRREIARIKTVVHAARVKTDVHAARAKSGVHSKKTAEATASASNS